MALTSRVRVRAFSEESLRLWKDRRPAIYTFWHERVLFILYVLGKRDVSIFTSNKGKSSVINKIASRLGLNTVTGALDAGGRHSVFELAGKIKGGNQVAISSDSPYSNPKSAQASALIIAQTSALPIVPISWNALFKIKIPYQQGKLIIPLPLNSIEIVLGPTVAIPKHLNFEELKPLRAQLSKTLSDLA